MADDTTQTAIEPLLGDSETERTRQRAAGIGAVVGAVAGSRRGVIAAGVAAGFGGAIGYLAGVVLTREGDQPVETDPVSIEVGDDDE